MPNVRKKIMWFSWYEWFFIIGIPVAIMSILLPQLHRVAKEEVPEVDRLMVEICGKMAQRLTDKNIRDQLSKNDKRVIDKHQISWDSNVFPIFMEKGKLKNKFYPHNHVVVYAKPIIVWTQKRVGRYCQTTCEISGREDPNELDRLVKVTRFGTFEILLGTISDPNAAAKQCDLTNNPEVYSYLFLKELIEQNEDFMEYAIVLAANKKHFINEWLADILRSAIISPPLPELPASYGEEEIFYNNLSEWFRQNSSEIQFINDFLFEDKTPSV